MSYQLQFSARAVPAGELAAFAFLNQLRQEAGAQPPAAPLQQLLETLTRLFPDSPWSDSEFAGDAGRLTLRRRQQEVLPHALYHAAFFGLTVLDIQTGKVHLPPTCQVVLEGPAPGVPLGDAAARLAALMRKPVSEMLALLSGGRRTVVKKGVARGQALQYVAVLRERAGCHASIALEPGPAAPPEPPPPAPPPVARTTGAAQTAPPAPVLPTQPAAGAPAVKAVQPALRPAPEEPDEAVAAADDASMYQLAEGVRLLCCAVGLKFLFRRVFELMAPGAVMFSLLLLMALAIAGAWRVMAGLAYGRGLRAAIVLLLAAPTAAALAGGRVPLAVELGLSIAAFLLVLALGVLATRRLKQAGMKVGLFGVAKAEVRRLGGLGERERLASTSAAWTVFGLLLLTYLGGSSTTSAERPQNVVNVAQVPCQLVGSWKYAKRGISYEVLLDDGGNWALDGNGQGVWRYADERLHWRDDSITPPRKEANILAWRPGGEAFTLVESDGSETLFQLQRRLPSKRCNY